MTFMRKITDFLNMDNWKDGKYFKPTEIAGSQTQSNTCHNAKANDDICNKPDYDAFLWQCNSIAKSRDSEDNRYGYTDFNNHDVILEPKWSSIRNEEKMELERTTVDLKNVTIYFKDGIIVDVIPDVYDYYKAQFYNVDGKIYDTYAIESVQSIPLFDFTNRKSLGTPVYYLEYLLRMRASQERKSKNNPLAYALLEKSTQLMKKTGAFYSQKDFLRLSNWLYEDGRYNQAVKVERDLLAAFPDGSSAHLEAFQHSLESCKSVSTDYIFCSSHQGTCPICSQYQCRVYCISGKDKRFPKLPDIVYQYGGFHKGCRHNFYPFFLDVNDTIRDQFLQDHNVYKYSNRPFIDDRTDREKQLYLDRLENQKRRDESALNKKIYYELMQRIPEVMPKSVAGFTKMKRANSANYQKIVNAAHDVGIEI